MPEHSKYGHKAVPNKGKFHPEDVSAGLAGVEGTAKTSEVPEIPDGGASTPANSHSGTEQRGTPGQSAPRPSTPSHGGKGGSSAIPDGVNSGGAGSMQSDSDAGSSQNNQSPAPRPRDIS